LNFKDGGFSPYAGILINLFIIESIKRAVSSFNPFAVQQVPTSDRIAVGMKNGTRWYLPDVYKLFKF
jgi:hypothetical protein